MQNAIITPTFTASASVLVDRAIGKPLSYGIPPHLEKEIVPGSRVRVPLRASEAKGTVIEVTQNPSYPGLLPIKAFLQDESLHDSDLYTLATWMANYYATPLWKVLSIVLPSTVRKTGKEKLQLFVKRRAPLQEVVEMARTLRNKKPSQCAILDVILKYPKGIFLSKLLEISGVSKSPIDTLVKEKVLEYKKLQIDRSLIEEEEFFLSRAKQLTPQQQSCFESIVKDLGSFHTHLIHGVTGSGKTEVYIRAIEAALEKKLGVLFLVPEISLTTQTTQRLKSRFTDRLAVLHHRLSAGERFDSWHGIKQGKIPIVVGARSAIFSPVKNLGLIIVDEEHDASYKNAEEMPTYNARDLAIIRGKMTKSVVLLGSATPSLESYGNALSGKYKLCTLPVRATGATLPKVTIVDMKFEAEKQQGFTLFSDPLLKALKERASRGEQSLLFLNRRGYHSSQTCQKCNHVVDCPDCDTALTFHRGNNILSCHFCNYSLSPPPRSCPKCGSDETLKFRGIGTEMVERSLHAVLPDIRTLRMDADTTTHKGSHEELLKQFRSGKADVLIGTQMIAKGLHFPSVTLVGILSADQSLHIPDFRASETAFQLITQVAGRSGRSELPGEVYIQTFMPDHQLIKFAATENYLDFYKQEMQSREMFDFPPHKRLICLTFTGYEPPRIQSTAESYLNALKKHLPDDAILYPLTPCGHSKIRGKFRFQSLIKCTNPLQITPILKSAPLYTKNLQLLIDVDPISTF